MQQLNPVYTWIVFLASFFMLVAANGMVELYGHVAGDDIPGVYDGDISYQKQKVAMGLGTVTLLIILLKIFDKVGGPWASHRPLSPEQPQYCACSTQVYYRERLLPRKLFLWLDSFYQRAEQERHQPAPSYPLSRVVSRSRSQSAVSAAQEGDNNHHDQHDAGSLSEGSESGPNRTTSDGYDHGPGGAAATPGNRLRASTIGSVRAGTMAGPRETLPVVEKEDLVMGIRRIRPLTLLRIAISITQFFLWEVKGIPLEDYMVYYAVLLVFPSVVEMGLEIRYIFVRPYHDEDGEIVGQHGGE